MIYICDFEDSFTYNIYSELTELTDTKIEIIHKKSILKFLKRLPEFQQRCLLILGPGPGHPQDYEQFFGPLQEILECQHILTLGICLGHQLIWQTQGAKIIHCQNPIHGMSVEYNLSQTVQDQFQLPGSISVQRYNSLCVNFGAELDEQVKRGELQVFKSGHELVMSRKDNLLTYQFHPESIGTTCPSSFFKPALNFLL